MRSLILDEGPPLDAASRAAALAARFPRLSAGEVADLAAIEPKRIQVYTNLIFAGERATLEWIYRRAAAAIGRLMHARDPSQPPHEHLFMLVRAMHAWCPWKSPSQRQLGADFEAFVRSEMADVLAAWPPLSDIVRFERIELDVFYAEDEPHAAASVARLDALNELTVEALMNVKVLRPRYCAVEHFQTDVLGVVEDWNEHDPLATAFSSGPTTAACGRGIETLLPTWRRLDEPTAAALTRATPGSACAVNDLAEAFLDTERDADTPEALFSRFYQELQGCLRAGILLCAGQ